MLNKNRSFLLMSTFILIIIIGYITIINADPPVVDPSTLDVEIFINDSTYNIGEEIEVRIYLHNNRFRAVKIDQEDLSSRIPVTISSTFHEIYQIHGIEGSSTVVKAKTRIFWGMTTFAVGVTGTFTIECLGEKVIIKVIFQDEELDF